MTKKEKIDELRNEIDCKITPLIKSDYVLLDLPYHSNIGDTLIWEGEMHFLGGLPYQMKGYGSMLTWTFPRLDKGTTVLLHGGGNFGNVWRDPQRFRLEVLCKYKDNPIVILPQTVHYDDLSFSKEDSQIMAQHPNLTICARDAVSYRFLEEHFSNRIIMAPDMAFCIPDGELDYAGSKSFPDRMLVIERRDKERGGCFVDGGKFSVHTDIRDWPTIERTTRTTRSLYKLMGVCKRIPLLRKPFAKIANNLAMNRLRVENIKVGVKLMGPYDRILSDRLHGAILAILMNKTDIYIADNYYGKNSAFFETWLQGVDGVEMTQKTI